MKLQYQFILIGFGVLIVLAAGYSFADATKAPREEAIGSSFIEDFDNFDRGRWLISNGWSNATYQGCTFAAKNISFETGGSVRLTFDDTPSHERPHSCSELQTHKKFGYGTYEVRMSSAVAPGLVTAFFTYTGPGPDSDDPHDEIDFEFLGRNSRMVQVNFFTNGVSDTGTDVALPFDSSSGVNDYAFEWRPDSIRWFVNGRLVHEAERKEGTPFPSHPGKIILSIWNGTGENMKNWLGAFEYPGRPLVGVYERVIYTKLGEPCQTPESIVCKNSAAEGSEK